MMPSFLLRFTLLPRWWRSSAFARYTFVFHYYIKQFYESMYQYEYVARGVLLLYYFK